MSAKLNPPTNSIAEKIAAKYFDCNCGEIYLSRKLTAPDSPFHSLDWEEAFKEIADISFEAGERCEYEKHFGAVPPTEPNKEQFINDLFDTAPKG